MFYAGENIYEKGNILIFISILLMIIFASGYLKNNAISIIKSGERARVTFSIAPDAEVYEFEGDDVKQFLSLIKPETWKKARLTLELAPMEHITFYKGETRYIVGILDADELMFKVYPASKGKFGTGSGYYKTNAVSYQELMDALREMCN